jgi:aspartyl-tRNA(Asn)/glutamyl-tRNA(Gln) amidotransferase subunit C
MADALTREQVQKIARLANIRLTDAELEKYAGQLGAILEYVDKLKTVDTGALPPTAQVTGMVNRTRPDAPRPSLTQAEALANAPEVKDGYFKIKAVL